MKKMLRKNGKSFNMTTLAFTLIELLGVIVILGLLSLIIYPVVNNVINSNKEKAYRQQIASLEHTSSLWALENSNKLSKEVSYPLSFAELKSSGAIEDKDLINPKTNEPLEGCIMVYWKEEVNQYKYEYSTVCEVIRGPIINISYTSITINMGDTYDFPEVTATLNDNSTVVLERPIIKKNALIVSTIDTSILNAVYELIYTVTDSSTGRSSSKTVTLTVVDATKPTVNIAVIGNPFNTSGWAKSNFNVGITVTDNESGAKSYKWCSTTGVSCSPTTQSSLPSGIVNMTQESIGSRICAIGLDISNNESEVVCSDLYKLDKTNPTIEGLSDITVNIGGTINLTAGVSTSDNLSGVNGTYTYDPTTISASAPGNHTVTYSVSDNAGNSTTVTRTVRVVAGEPSLNYAVVGNPFNANSWAKANFEVTITGTDNSGLGIKNIKYCLTTGSNCIPSVTVTSISTNVTISTESASNKICSTVEDNNNKTSSVICSGIYKLDKTLPTISGLTNILVDKGDTINLTNDVTVSDTLSGVSGTYSMNPSSVSSATAGTTTVTYTVTDNAGNTNTGTRTVKVMDISFEYSGEETPYTVEQAGIYIIEAWGSQGGGTGGLGGYVKGEIYLNVGDVISANIGGTNGYNGGGAPSVSGNGYYGGGATTVKINNALKITAAGGGAGTGGTSGGTGNGAGGASSHEGSAASISNGGAGTNGGGGGTGISKTGCTAYEQIWDSCATSTCTPGYVSCNCSSCYYYTQGSCATWKCPTDYSSYIGSISCSYSGPEICNRINVNCTSVVNGITVYVGCSCPMNHNKSCGSTASGYYHGAQVSACPSQPVCDTYNYTCSYGCGSCPSDCATSTCEEGYLNGNCNTWTTTSLVGGKGGSNTTSGVTVLTNSSGIRSGNGYVKVSIKK